MSFPGKRTAVRMPHSSNKKRSGITIAKGEYIGVEKGVDSDETVVDRLKIIKCVGSSNQGKTIAGDHDDDQDDCQVVDEEEEDSEGKKAVPGVIQEYQELENESELVAQKGVGLEKVSSGRSLTLEDFEAEYQTGGLQGKVEDQIWDSICEPLEIPSFHSRMRLWQKLITGHINWRRTDLRFSHSFWMTHRLRTDSGTENDTRSSISSLLIPDYATTAQVGEQQLFVILLEGKIARNTGVCQVWDDLTKLGQEMKVALDSILKLEPEYDVWIIGVLVRELLVEFFTLRIHAEATYIMHKFAPSYIAPNAINAFPLVHLMEVFEHAKVKVEQTVSQIRQ
ncbi:hypothetical protein BGZ83_002527, partial [Gryganskiella cystojenkinii]